MEISPVVSVIVLCFNHEQYIKRTLWSVIFQTFRDFEIIFIDNNSQDNSYEIGYEILKSSGVKFFAEKTSENLGISKGLNYGLNKYARGHYIATLAGDDWWDMENLQYKVDFAGKHPQVGMVYGNGYNFNNVTEESTIFYKTPSISGWILKDLLKAPNINPQGILYKHSLIKELGYFDANAKVEDRDLWYRIARVAPIGYVHKPLTFYRVNQSNNISRNISYMREGNEYFFRKYEQDFPKEINIARKRQYQYFAYHLATNEPGWNAIKYIVQHYQFNLTYNKQLLKCFINVFRKKL